jgi:4-diphosphocytidyl-2-C-methyl-D-erythritol kinase
VRSFPYPWRVHLTAYAKINLGLRVLERRPDGFHNIETIFHRVALSDRLTFEPADEIQVVSTDAAAPGDETNLCYRAAVLLRELTGSRAGVRITLEKQIPVGAGLGGGSSDAATVLKELPRFWQTPVDLPRMLGAALRLGSDVPFFLGSQSALAFGRGEILEYFPLTLPFTILLCSPAISVSTTWAYRQVAPRASGGGEDPGLKTILIEGLGRPEVLRAALINDFEPVVFAAYPEIAAIKRVILDGNAHFALMSGSGSSVYGLFADEPSASRTADILRKQGYRVSLTPPGFNPGGEQ